jgi:hypothetical protein
VIGLLIDMRENSLTNFPFNPGGEHFLPTVCKELSVFAFGHNFPLVGS